MKNKKELEEDKIIRELGLCCHCEANGYLMGIAKAEDIIERIGDVNNINMKYWLMELKTLVRGKEKNENTN